MKKILVIATNRLFSSSLVRGALIPSLALGLGLAFWTATTPVAKAQDSTANKSGKGGSKPGKGGPPGGKCDVCHNPHNYHTISIPCDQVDKFLSNHPGDFRGKCEVTGVTNP